MPTGSDSPDSGKSITELVRTDRLQLLFRQSFVAVFGSLGAAGLLSWLLWDHGNRQHILLWMALLTLATLCRLWMFLGYFRATAAEQVPERWERRYWITLVLSAGLWGFGALVVMPKDSLLHQAFTLIFTIGMAGSATSTYSAHRWMTLWAIVLVLFPCTLWFLLQGTQTHLAMALATLLFQVSAFRATGELAGGMETSFRLGREMVLAHGIADRAARTDELTGLSNRRAFFERGEQLISYCQRNARAASVLVLDVDHFKHINDSWGHLAGDQVLRRVGELLRQKLRKSDVCGRMGGEEFALLLADTPLDAALEVAEALRESLSALRVEAGTASPITITASLGVATSAGAGYDLHALLQQADAAMYRAKAGGRNRSCAANAAPREVS